MNSIGLVEVKNVSKGIVVTDEMLKSAGIVLISSGSVCPGKICHNRRRRTFCYSCGC